MARRKSKVGPGVRAGPEPPWPDGVSKSGRREWLILAGILLVGFLLRAAYLAEVRRAPDFDAPGVDAGFHDYWARGLAFGEWTRPGNRPDPKIRSRPYIRPPGYPYFLALVYKVFGGSYLAPRVIQMVLGLVNGLLAFAFARRWYGSHVGLVLAGFMAVYWIFIYYEAHFHEPVLMVFLLLALVNLLGLWAQKRALGYALAAGLLSGLAALTRPNALLFVPLVLVWFGWVGRARDKRRRVGPAAAAFALAAALTIAPVTVRNYRVSRQLVLISANLGINLLIGNHENATGLFVRHLEGVGEFGTCYDYPRLIENLQAELGRPLNYTQASSHFAGRALVFMRDHPARVLLLMLKKAWLFWGPYEISHNKEVQYERSFSRVLGHIPVNFPVVVSLFVVGLAMMAGQRRYRKQHPPTAPAPGEGQSRMTVLVLLIIAVYFGSYLPFFNTALYRVPIIPFLLLFGACGVVGVWRLAARGDYGRTILWALAALALFVVTSIPVVPYGPDLAKWHFSRAAAYARKGENEPAIREYQQAINLRPAFFEARFTLGWLLLEEGRMNEGIEQMRRCLELRPNSLETHNRLANAYLKQRRVPQALVHYAAALELDPSSAVLRANFGIALLQVGRDAEGLEQLEEALRLDPQDPIAHATLGTYLLEHARPEEAMGHFTEAVRLDPSWSEVRVRLATVLEQVGRREEAIHQYREVLRLDPQHRTARARLEALSPGQSRTGQR